MPPSDQEPRYRLVDSNGNVVGALWGDGNGNVKIADETDTQTTFGPDGISTPALDATNSITDANGTTHSGELAETSQLYTDSDAQAAVDTGKVYFQASEPTETPDPNNGTGGVWYPQTSAVLGSLNTFSLNYTVDGSERSSSWVIDFEDYYVCNPQKNDTLISVNYTDNSINWETTLPDEYGAQELVGNKLYSQVIATGNSGSVYGIDADDGTIEWTTSVGVNPSSYWAIDGDTAFIAWTDDTIRAFNVNFGDVTCTKNLNKTFYNWAAAKNDVAVFGATDEIVVLEQSDGSQRWASSKNSSIYGIAIGSDEVVYTYGSSISADKLSDGNGGWLSGLSDGTESGIAISDGTVVVGDDNGEITALDLSDGTVLWTYTLPDGRIRSDIIIYNGVVYAGNGNTVYARDLADGSEVWTEPVASNNTPDIFATDGTYFTTTGTYNDGGTTQTVEQDVADRYETPKVSNGTNWVTQI